MSASSILSSSSLLLRSRFRSTAACSRIVVITGVTLFVVISFLLALHATNSSIYTDSVASLAQYTPLKGLFSSSPRVWEPPAIDPIIHGIHVSDALNADPLYPLEPFPHAEIVAPQQVNGELASWLIAVICGPWDGARRMMIRSTWMRLYEYLPFDARFVISNPGPQWTEIIRQENRTFGDIIVLDTLQEDDFTANTVKTLGFYKWLLEKSPQKYEWVTKLDTDLWLNARGFWDRFLVPRLSNETGSWKSTVQQTFIGQLYYSPRHRTVFPHGSMYTVTWDIVDMMSKLQDEHHVIAGEDLALAILMLKGNQTATIVNFKGSEKFDFDERDVRPPGNTAWAPNTTVVQAAEHALYGDQIIAVHQLKEDDTWLKVADCFDEHGVKPMPEKENALKNTKPAIKYSKSRFLAIPEYYWEKKDNRTWICNGIWRTEPGVERNPDL